MVRSSGDLNQATVDEQYDWGGCTEAYSCLFPDLKPATTPDRMDASIFITAFEFILSLCDL